MKKIFALFISLALAAIASLGNVITFYESGCDIYDIVRQIEDPNKVWNGTGWETWNDANIADYAFTTADKGGDIYSLDSNSLGITAAGEYLIISYLLEGDNPSTTDSPVGCGKINWTGSAEYNIAADANIAAAALTNETYGLAASKTARDACDTAIRNDIADVNTKITEDLNNLKTTRSVPGES